MKTFTAATIRNTIKAAIKSGMSQADAESHAEFCLEQAESQLGDDKCKAARAELKEIMAAQ